MGLANRADDDEGEKSQPMQKQWRVTSGEWRDKKGPLEPWAGAENGREGEKSQPMIAQK